MPVACLPMTSRDTSTPADAELAALVRAWSASANAVLDLVADLDEQDLGQPTDLPGWSVGDVVAHLAHLESELSGEPPVLAEVDAVPADARDDAFRTHTERGVAARRGRSQAELVDELTRAVGKLATVLSEDVPASPPASFPRPGTTWEALLRDRTLDYWMHEQDIRRALDRPGGWESAGAGLTVEVFRRALPFVVGKRVHPATGTTVQWIIDTGQDPDIIVVRMDDDGRARLARPASPSTTTLAMTLEEFVLACGGRRRVEELAVHIDGDRALGLAVLACMAVTP